MRGSDDSSGSLFGYVDLETGARPYETKTGPLYRLRKTPFADEEMPV